MCVKVYNPWLFWWCHPQSCFSESLTLTHLPWDSFDDDFLPQSQGILTISSTVLLLSFWVKEWRIIDVEKPLFGLFSSIQVGFGVEAVEAAAHCPKKIPSSPILCDWVSKPKFRTWRKVLKEEKWGIWSQMAKLLLLVPKVVEPEFEYLSQQHLLSHRAKIVQPYSLVPAAFSWQSRELAL